MPGPGFRVLGGGSGLLPVAFCQLLIIGMMKKTIGQYDAIVMGASAGGLAAISKILETLPRGYGVPILLVQHRSKDSTDIFEEVLQRKSDIRVKQADEKEKILPGWVYVAPPDYHMLVEKDRTLSFSYDPPVQFSRPSIDVLFESAALVYQARLVGIILTGTNRDGTRGIQRISEEGGLTIAQDPEEAQYSDMTRSAIGTKAVRHVWPLSHIANFLKGKVIA